MNADLQLVTASRVVVVLAPSFFPACLLSESLYKVDVYNIRMWVEIRLGICWGGYMRSDP